MPGPTVPDSPLARAAEALAEATAPPWVVAHSRRTYRFGLELLLRAGRTPDPEVLYVAAMLHDLALGTSLDDGRTPFELLSAAAARDLVLARGGSPASAVLVHDAVALHLDPATADDPRPEVAGIQFGSALDVIGLRAGDLPATLLDEVLAAHPRDGFRDAMLATFGAEAASKPGSGAAVLVERYGFLDLMAVAARPAAP